MSTSEALVDLSDKSTADIQYKVAATRAERAAAFRLVYRSYLDAGLGQPNVHEMRVTPYHLLPGTEVFVATCEDEVIFTVSLMTDGELGLPMESVYGNEIALRRAVGLRFGEVSCLADRRSQFRGFFPVFLRLSRLVVQYARRQGLDELLLAVHPRHARFYRRFMDFRQFGEEKAYPTARNHPAIALSLNFARVDRERHENSDTFFGQSVGAEMLQPQPINPADQDYFGSMVDGSFHLAPLGHNGLPGRVAAGRAVSAA